MDLKYIGVIENKLSSKDRKELSEKTFGLPDERKYPLNDEEHVRKAIQFFKYCPPAKKRILADAINKRAKGYGMKVQLSSDSPFYKYADKSIVTETSVAAAIIRGNQKCCGIDLYDDINMEAQGLLNNLMTVDISTEQELIELEKNLRESIIPRLITLFKTDNEKGEHCLNPLKYVNDIMKYVYETFFSLNSYINNIEEEDFNSLFFSVIEDLSYTISNGIQEDSCTSVKDNVKIFIDLISNTNCNMYYVQRKIDEILYTSFLEDLIYARIYKDPYQYEHYRSILSDKEESIILLKQSTEGRKFGINTVVNSKDQILNGVLKSSNMNLINTTNYLNNLKNELKSQINIILKSNRMCVSGSWTDDKSFYMSDVPRENRLIFDIISFQERSLDPAVLGLYDKDIDLYLDEVDLMIITKIRKVIKSIYISKDKFSNNIYYGLNDDLLYLIGKNKNVSGELILIKLFDKVDTGAATSLMRYIDQKSRKPISIKRIQIQPYKVDSSVVTEGISINEKGDIKFEIKPNKTYMDEYAENHKILDMNSKSGNINGMKRNLAFLFALINTIERDVIYADVKKKNKLSSEKINDATKARTFAINDFKTYLKQVQKAEPRFDFTKYYEESGYDKFIVSVPHETVVGIKKLFRTIMLG
jgi:hypothetical protein